MCGGGGVCGWVGLCGCGCVWVGGFLNLMRVLHPSSVSAASSNQKVLRSTGKTRKWLANVRCSTKPPWKISNKTHKDEDQDNVQGDV